jgi:hypothetical protein
MRTQLGLSLLGLTLFAATAYGQNPFSRNEPIVVNPNSLYPTIAAPPGQPFHPVAYNTNSIVDQLAHSSDGTVRLPPGDYAIPVRMY